MNRLLRDQVKDQVQDQEAEAAEAAEGASHFLAPPLATRYSVRAESLTFRLELASFCVKKAKFIPS